MKGKRLFVKSTPEVEQAVKLNLPKAPKVEIEAVDFYFYFHLHLHAIGEAYITTDGWISILIHGREVFLKNEPKVWNRIKRYLE